MWHLSPQAPLSHSAQGQVLSREPAKSQHGTEAYEDQPHGAQQGSLVLLADRIKTCPRSVQILTWDPTGVWGLVSHEGRCGCLVPPETQPRGREPVDDSLWSIAAQESDEGHRKRSEVAGCSPHNVQTSFAEQEKIKTP